MLSNVSETFIFQTCFATKWTRSVDESTLDLLVWWWVGYGSETWEWDLWSLQYALSKEPVYFVYAYSRVAVQRIVTIAVIKHVFVLFPWLQLQHKCVENESVICFQQKTFLTWDFFFRKPYLENFSMSCHKEVMVLRFWETLGTH